MWIKINVQKVRSCYKILFLVILPTNTRNINKELASSRWTGTNCTRALLRVEPRLCLAIYRHVTVLCRTEVRYYASYDVFSQTIGSRKPLTGRASSATSIHLSTASFITRICASLHFFVDLIFHTIFLMAQVFIVSFTIVDVTSKNVKMTNVQKDVQERQGRWRV